MNAHPVANLFPLMSGEEFAELKADIAENGLREPVWTYKGQIVDGRNRWRACHELGIACPTREWDGQGSLVAFVLSLNLHRRHLSASQRAALGAEVEPMLAEEAKKRQESAGSHGSKGGRGKKKTLVANLPQGFEKPADKARDDAAKLTGSAGRSVGEAKEIKKKSPELFEQVKSGKMSVNKAKSELRKQARREQLAKIASASQPTGGEWRIIHGDVIETLEKLEERPALVFADPPYNIGIDYGEGVNDKQDDAVYMEWVARWLGLCFKVTTESASLWVLINDEYAAEYKLAIQAAGFVVRNWVKWYESFGVNCSDKFNRTSRHLFYAVKNPKRFTFNPDAVGRPSARQVLYNDGRAAEGGKLWDDVWAIPRLVGTAEERIPDFPTQLPLALLRPIIEATSNPGDLVLDPFNGSGTTGQASVEAGRRYIGIEKQTRFFELAMLRMKGVNCAQSSAV